MLYLTILITVISFLFSFFLIPASNLKMYSLIYDIGRVKPSFHIKPGHFYSGIDGMVIHVAGIDDETDMLYKVKIYDHSEEIGNNKIIMADSAVMYPGGRYLMMDLYHGVNHEDSPRENEKVRTYGYQRFYFDTLTYRAKLSGFDLSRTDEQTFAPHQYMQPIGGLKDACDSISGRVDTIRADLGHYMKKYLVIRPELLSSAIDSLEQGKNIIDYFDLDKQSEIISTAIHSSRAIKNYSTVIDDRLEKERLKHRKFLIEYQFRYALPASCLVFLFLGAPLGAIIRKGGLGLPVIISILFFVLFYILMIQGRKFARDEILPVWMGVWLPMLVMFPIALTLTYEATTDSPIMFSTGWRRLFYRLRNFIARFLPFL